jgi:hypothetical protein
MRNCNAVLLVVTLSWASGLYGQADPRSTLQQRLTKQYALATVAKDRSTVLTAGTTLILQRDNLLMYSGSCPTLGVNAYKNGKVIQPAGSKFLHDLGGSMRMQGGATTADCPQRKFTRGTYLFVTRTDVVKDGVVFQLFATPENEAPYYAELKFPFEKNSVPPAGEELATIGEVLQIQQDAPATAANTPPPPGIPAPPPPPPEAPVAPIPPPPPPADTTPPLAPIPPPPPPAAEPFTVEIGQTVERVEGGLGKPNTILKLAPGTVRYVYSSKGIKITFKNGKVSDIQ